MVRLLQFQAPLGLAVLTCALALQTVADENASRRFTFQYETTVGPIPPGAGPVHVFVPLARASEQQRVLSEEVSASIPGAVEVEEVYGNRYWHGHLDQAGTDPIEVRVRTTVERRVSRRAAPVSRRRLSDAERREYAAFLDSNVRVAVGHPMLEPIRAEVAAKAGSDDPGVVARAIYDWVIDNVEYKKVGSGWGNGDTFWACSERYGNCTDFHALFISLARSEGIPARFEIGFPVPADPPSGPIAGYHCWVQFYLPDVGWFPIDASEAFKHPDEREYFYGTHPADRIHLTTGRDLVLGSDHRGPPLNYFVYPYVEVGGKPWTGGIERSFSYAAEAAGAPR